MAHVGEPLLVVGVLRRGSTSKVINRCLVGISVEDVDVAETSTHFDGVVSCTSIGTLRLVTDSWRTGVGANTLGDNSIE